MAFITIYCGVFVYLFVGMIYIMKYGKIYSLLTEFGIAFAFDQIKSLPSQLIIYWVCIRRCGNLQINEDFGGKWDDELMVDSGVDQSLFSYLREKTNKFIENKIISNLIIAMTLFLCLVIFSELSIADLID
jgi:hypothetical protein